MLGWQFSNVIIFSDERKETLLSCDSKLSSDFEKLFENCQLSDVTLKLGDQEFRAHNSVLSARSKVFAAMFEHDMKENRQDMVDLVQMEADTARDMLRFIYCGKVRELTPSEALNVYVAADRHDLEELRIVCRDIVLKGISMANVCDVAAIADIHNDELLIGELKSFISKNGKDIVNTEKWKTVCTNNPALGAKMFEWLFRP
ncbi:speckle-type POZ protein-like B [Uloborus diversus]|uniref:speckle-type POZ protein-like B n=1 Tax=Uloborus diversus TaxID=327109 RepID=UPI00240A2672|nr:speckle-type POZ protein-like B [Uloborus diversus]